MSTASLLQQWEQDFKDLLLANELLGKKEWEDIYERIQSIFDLLLDEISTVESLPVITKQSKIDSLALGPSILTMVRDQIPIPIIATALSNQIGVEISSKEVDQWVILYNKDHNKNSRPSVFETSSRLEDVHDLIHKHISYVEALDEDDFRAAKTTKAQVMLEVYKELRMLYKDANQLVASVKQLESIKEFQDLVLSVIKDASPAQYHTIIRKLNERKAALSAFTP